MVSSTSATLPETQKPSGMEQQKNSPALIGCKTISHGREPGQLEKGGFCYHRKLYTRIFDNKLHNSAPSVLWSVTAFESTTCPTPLVSCCCLKAREAGITLEPGHKHSPLTHAAEEEGGSTALNPQSISPGFCFELQNQQDSWHYAQLQLPEPFPSTWVQEQEGHNIRERGEAAS